MVESGTTISWEAWDQKYKPNQDWNHAWGAAPANLLPRYILGVEPLTPGWDTARIRPRIGGLSYARGFVPTPRGQVHIHWNAEAGFKLTLSVPEGMKVQLELPGPETSAVFIGGKRAVATRSGNRWILVLNAARNLTVEVR